MNSAKLSISCAFIYDDHLLILRALSESSYFSILCIVHYIIFLEDVQIKCPDMTAAIFYLTKTCGCAGHLIHQDALCFYE